MAIPSQTIEQVAAANDIVEVISSYFPLKRAGANFKALCPFHKEKTPSFHVSPQRQTFHCFGCGAGGSVFRFVMEYEHVDFPSAVRKLAARVGIPIIEERRGPDEDRQYETRRVLLKLHAEAAEWFHENLLKREFGDPARQYLRQRGVDRQVAKNWQLGFAPDAWDGFLKWATARGYSREQLLQSGLVKPRDEERAGNEFYDRFRGRIIFPICNDVGEIIAFSGRLLQSDTQAAKYLNSPETPLFRKGSVLFGLHRSKRSLIEANCAVVCEGQLDLIALFEAGITNVVAPQGTAFTEDQARILKRFVKEVVLCYDSDTAGQNAAERSLSPLLQTHSAWFNAFWNHFYLRIAEMPPGEDPDSLIRREGADVFRERISNAPDFFDYWIDRASRETDLSSVRAKLDLARSLGVTISAIHDPMLRGQVVHKVATRLSLPPSEVDSVVKKPSIAAAPTPPEHVEVVQGHALAMLCVLALHDDAARKFLLQQNWREVLDQIPGAELLVRILESDLRPEDTASMNAFMASLSPADERLVSAWLMQKVPENPLAVAEQWWNGLCQALLRRQLQIAEGRLRLPQINAGELLNLQKQILDLRQQLHEFSPFSSARSGDK